MVKKTRWEGVKATLPRPSNVPQTVWSKMNYLQRYNLSKGLLVWDKRTRKCKRSRLAMSTGIGLTWQDIPTELEYVPLVSDPKKIILVPKRLQKKKKKKKVTKKVLATHHRSIDPLVLVSGSGSFMFSDKSTYVGEISNSLPHGNGIRSWGDGSTYTGRWNNGVRTGHGSMVYPTGEEYIGLWKNDTKTGRGTMFRKNGAVYIADWDNNLVIKPYTKKSSNEQAYDVYKVYLKLGTYQKVADKLGIDKDRAQKLVRRYRQLRSSEIEKPQDVELNLKKKPQVAKAQEKKAQEKKAQKKKETIHRHLFNTSPRNYFINTSSIEKLNLVPRTIQILKRNGIVTLRDLTKTSGRELLRIPGLGTSVFKTIELCLKEFGLRLKSSVELDTKQSAQKRRKKLKALDNYGIYMSEKYS